MKIGEERIASVAPYNRTECNSNDKIPKNQTKWTLKNIEEMTNEQRKTHSPHKKTMQLINIKPQQNVFHHY